VGPSNYSRCDTKHRILETSFLLTRRSWRRRHRTRTPPPSLNTSSEKDKETYQCYRWEIYRKVKKFEVCFLIQSGRQSELGCPPLCCPSDSSAFLILLLQTSEILPMPTYFLVYLQKTLYLKQNPQNESIKNRKIIKSVFGVFLFNRLMQG